MKVTIGYWRKVESQLKETRMKTYLCPKPMAESREIIAAFSEVDDATTPTDNDEGRCIVICSDNAQTDHVARRFDLEDVSEDDEGIITPEIIDALERLGNACISYVGSANYQTRENAAKLAFRNGTAFARAGNLKALQAVRIISRG